MRTYYYTDNKNVIKLNAKRKPSYKTMPIGGTWVIREFTNKHGWEMPCFAEVTIERLNKMQYIGSVPIDK